MASSNRTACPKTSLRPPAESEPGQARSCFFRLASPIASHSNPGPKACGRDNPGHPGFRTSQCAKTKSQRRADSMRTSGALSEGGDHCFYGEEQGSAVFGVFDELRAAQIEALGRVVLGVD